MLLQMEAKPVKNASSLASLIQRSEQTRNWTISSKKIQTVLISKVSDNKIPKIVNLHKKKC